MRIFQIFFFDILNLLIFTFIDHKFHFFQSVFEHDILNVRFNSKHLKNHKIKIEIEKKKH